MKDYATLAACMAAFWAAYCWIIETIKQAWN